jgi:hypothetical protein
MSIFDTSTTTGSQQSTTLANQQQTAAGTQMQNQNQLRSDIFTPQQQALQGMAGQFAMNMLQGYTPPAFNQPNPAVAEWANYNFDRYELPRINAKFGPGSAVSDARRQEMNLGLAAQAAQQGQGNALNAFNQAWQFAMRPVGTSQDQASLGSTTSTANTLTNQATNTDFSQNTKRFDAGGLLEVALPFLAGVFPEVFR